MVPGAVVRGRGRSVVPDVQAFARRHCEERSDEAIQAAAAATVWFASLRSQCPLRLHGPRQILHLRTITFVLATPDRVRALLMCGLSNTRGAGKAGCGL